MKKGIKRLLIISSVALMTLLLLYLLRIPLLRGMGNYLINDDQVQKVDAAFVLSGASYERSKEGALIFDQGYAPIVVATGGNISQTLLSMNMELYEADISAAALERLGVDRQNIEIIQEGTSTYEEAEIISRYAQEKGWNQVMIISSAFHTRRVNNVFKKRFRNTGIEINIHSAPPVQYSIESWWEKEEGLMSVYSEYVKLIYYAIKY